MDAVQLCEIVMLVAFGCSWPFNIAKSWRSRTAKGKSVIFEFIIIGAPPPGQRGWWWRC